MDNNRKYKRVNINIPCVIFNQTKGKEYEATLKDVSEEGVGIYIFTSDEINKEDKCMIQFVDHHSFEGKRDHCYLYPLLIKWIKKENNSINTGCIVSNPDERYKKYVDYKKAADFIEKIGVNSEIATQYTHFIK